MVCGPFGGGASAEGITPLRAIRPGGRRDCDAVGRLIDMDQAAPRWRGFPIFSFISSMKNLIIIGAGGLGTEAAWVAQRTGEFHLLGFCDDAAAKKGLLVQGQPVFGSIEEAAGYQREAEPVWFHCGVGNNRDRQSLAQRAERVGWQAATLIDPSALVSPDAKIGAGCYVGAGSIVSVHATLLTHVLINQHCTIGHDSFLASYAQVCPGGRISGNVRLEEGAFVASNAVVAPGRWIGPWATVGAASFASRNVEAGVTVVGVPARPLFGP